MKNKFLEFIKWFNSLKKGEIPSISQAQLTLCIGYTTLFNYYMILQEFGYIVSSGNTRNKKYIKTKNFCLEHVKQKCKQYYINYN